MENDKNIGAATRSPFAFIDTCTGKEPCRTQVTE